MKTPLITIFMAVYNGHKYIADAIKSVLNQSFDNFELLIINDGSTDNSVQIINQFTDERIRLIHHEQNKGLFHTRNRGINESRGIYFATLDCDDIATTNRLKWQVDFFKRHPDYAVCGGQGKIINEDSKVIGAIQAPYGSPEFIRALSLFYNPFINSATMIRKSVLEEFSFNPDYEAAEDYDLFQRIMDKYQTANLKKNLVYYRMHTDNISEKKQSHLIDGGYKIITRQLERMGANACRENLDRHYCFISRKFSETASLQIFEDWLLQLDRLNTAGNYYQPDDFRKALFDQWVNVSTAYCGKLGRLKDLFSKIGRLQSFSFRLGYLSRKVLKS